MTFSSSRDGVPGANESHAVARESAERTLQLLTRLHQVVGALAGGDTPEAIAKVIVEQGAAALRAMSGVLVRPNDGRLELVASHGLPGDVVDAWQTFAASERTPIGTAFLSGQPVWLERSEDLVRQYPQLTHVPASATAAALPLVLRGRVLAVIGFRFDGPRVFALEERAVVLAMAAYAAQALDRADAYANEVANRRGVEALGQLAEELSRALTTEDVARIVVNLGSLMARADTCTLYALDQETRSLELIGQQGCNPEVLRHIRRITPESGNPVYRTVASGEPVWIENEQEYAVYYPALGTMKVPGPRASAFWATPLIAEGRPVGLLGMGFREPRTFPAEERRFVAIFTRQCAEALVRARRLEAERAARTRAEQLQASLSTTLRSIGDAVIATDTKGLLTIMNHVAEELTGWRESEAVGRPLADVLRVLDSQTRLAGSSPVDRVLEEGVIVGLPAHTVLVRRDGREIPIEDSGAPIRGDSGAVEGVVLVFRDVTQKKREERRWAFLVEATTVLAESLDYEETLSRVAHLAVPRWADWSAIDVVRSGDRIPKRVAVAHVDPAKIGFANDLAAKYPTDPDATTGVPNVLRTGKSELYPNIPDEMLVAGCVDDEHLRMARALGLRSAIVVPLTARGRTFGAMTFVLAESPREYDEDDLRFAEDLARRCATAIDNAQLYASQQQARESADIANRAKDEFLAIVSHELRTPLNSIMGWAKMMSSPSLSDGQRDRARDTIERNAVAMAQLIEDLLDMSRVISGKMRLELQEVDLAAVVEAALESIRPAADARSVQITPVLDGMLPPVPGDPARLQQVIWNLLSNAVKFTSKGGQVRVTLARADSWAEIRVVDTGKGIAPRFLPYVFDPFRQEEGGALRSRGGLGLGLAITRQLVELHGGRIEARSDGEGRGAEFIARLPLSATQLQGQSPEPSPVRPPSFEKGSALQGLRILVVDDDEDARLLMKAILEACGCRVTLAEGVEAALAAFSREVPDLLLSDIAMPERDGCDLIRHVRALPPNQGGDLPAVALTAYARAEDRRRVFDAGFSMHVPKPVEPTELVHVLASLTRYKRPRA